MLNHVKGNLIDLAEQGVFDAVVQGCNCICQMGAGIAREIKLRYPGAYEVDAQTTPWDFKKLGNYTLYYASGFDIINAYTQFRTARTPGEDVFEYAAFELITRKLAHLYPGRNIGLPYIGMGLAGGSKERIMLIIENFAKAMADTGGTVTLVEFAKV